MGNDASPYEVRRFDDEDVLVAAARDGDHDAFAELVRSHENEVFTLALRLVRDRDLASDVAQEAFVRAWRAMPRFRAEAKFSTWMHRITVNTAFTQRSRQKRRRAESLDDFIEPAADGLTPERAGAAVASRPAIEDALGELSLPVRSVVVLKDVYDWSHAEIADHLGISVTAAKVRLHRGRKQLRALLWDHAEARL